MGERVLFVRQTERRAVGISGLCRTSSRQPGRVELTDISAGGCCISLEPNWLEPNQVIVICPDGFESLTGRVRWIKGKKAGIKFDRPLYGPVVDHLSRSFAKGRGGAVSLTRSYSSFERVPRSVAG